MRPLVAAILLLALAALCGCGSSGGETGSSPSPPAAPPGATARACALDAGGVGSLRAARLSCGGAEKVAVAWAKAAACRPAAGASRAGCSVGSYRCLAAATDRGWSVSCSRPGRSLSFTAKR